MPVASRHVMAVGLALTGCAPTYTTVDETPISHRTLVSPEARAPELDEFSAHAKLEGDLARVSVQARPACRVRVVERERVQRVTRTAPSAGVLIAESVAAGLGASVVAASLLADQEDSEGHRQSNLVAAFLGVPTVLLGVAVLVDATKYDTHTVVVTRADPVGDRVVRCSSTAPPQAVAIVVPGRPPIVAELDEQGHALLPLAPELWPSDGRLDAELWVDGVLVRRVVFDRGAR